MTSPAGWQNVLPAPPDHAMPQRHPTSPRRFLRCCVLGRLAAACAGTATSATTTGEEFDVLAEPLADVRLMFAGKATIRRYAGTVHGAYLSGVREAERVANIF